MGQDISGQLPVRARVFTKALLRDLHALERMLGKGLFETGVRRIGAELEMYCANDGWRPASTALDILQEVNAPFTTRCARYNLEANVEPRVLARRCLTDLEARVVPAPGALSRVRAVHAYRDAR